jgi:hypothetical protein
MSWNENIKPKKNKHCTTGISMEKQEMLLMRKNIKIPVCKPKISMQSLKKKCSTTESSYK